MSLINPCLCKRQTAHNPKQAHVNGAPGDYMDVKLRANLVSMEADDDDDWGQLRVSAEILCGFTMTKLAINVNVSILAEFPMY